VSGSRRRWNEPPPKLRLPAPKVLKPAADRPLEPVIRDFMGWQAQLADRIRIADGLDLSRARSRAPALPLFKWTLGKPLCSDAGARTAPPVAGARQVRNDQAFPR
jgi:hypothetical protein